MTSESFNEKDYVNHLVHVDTRANSMEEAILMSEFSVEKYKKARSEFNLKFNEIFDITSDSYNRSITYEEYAIAKEHLDYLDSHFNKMVECIEIYKKIVIEARSYLNNPANRKEDAFSILEKFEEIKANIPAIPEMSNELREKLSHFDPRLNDTLLKFSSEATSYRGNFSYLTQIAHNLNMTIYNYDKNSKYTGSDYFKIQKELSESIVESTDSINVLKQSIDSGKLSEYELERAQKEILRQEENIKYYMEYSNRIDKIEASVKAERKDKNNDSMLNSTSISNYNNFDYLSVIISGFKTSELAIIEKTVSDYFVIDHVAPIIDHVSPTVVS